MVCWGIMITLIIVVLYVAQFAVLLMLEHRRQAHLTAWVLVVLLLPFIGFVAYWIIGRRPAPYRQQMRHPSTDQNDLERHSSTNQTSAENQTACSAIHSSAESFGDMKDRFPKLMALIANSPDFLFTNDNQTQVLTNGEETYDVMLKEMSKAKHHIHLDYYTIRADATGQLFLALLTEKAKRGVEVKLIYDGVGTLKLESAFLEKLHASGCRTACFAPPFRSLLNRRLNFRNHRKILVIDGVTGFLGGINIGDEYVGHDPKLGFWRDTHLMVKGDSVGELQHLFMEDWEAAAGETMDRQCSNYFPGHSATGDEKVLIVSSVPSVQEQKIVEVLHSVLMAAQSCIFASTPYFIPDPIIAAALAMAARSGIEVKLILPGVSDSKLVLLATLSHVQDMLDAGVRVYRYRKGFIHAKVLIVDDSIASVGSANLDLRSLYSNYELLAFLFDPKPINKLRKDFEDDLKQCEAIDPERFVCRSRKQKVAEGIMHILSPLL
jgi:cardiolipin synthase A/B